MITKFQLIETIERLKVILIAASTGGEASNDEYTEIRQLLISDTRVTAQLPKFMKSCRNVSEFWAYIKVQYHTYADRRNFIREQFEGVLDSLEHVTLTSNEFSQYNLFNYQFPLGLPFGKTKPTVASVSEKGGQRWFFEDRHDVGVIDAEVYPDFTFAKLSELMANRPINQKDFKTALIGMNQTDSEKKLFIAYAKKYSMSSANVPVLVPQAWIQWHSLPKSNLRQASASYTDDLYRVDFVAFWSNKRYAILVDDVSHYATHVGGRWDASEEKYSSRLKEDRKLRKEGWQVFRLSNWETRDNDALEKCVADLFDFFQLDR